jgi:hypothetical protein
MRNFSKLAVVGAAGVMGTSAVSLPASAATLALDFAPTPTSYTALVVSSALSQVSQLGWEFTLTSSVTVSGLGAFDAGSSSNIPSSTAITLYSGSLTNKESTNSIPAASILATASVGGGTGTQDYAWLTTSITSVTLTAGSYFILENYPTPNSPYNVAGAPNTTKNGSGNAVDQQITTIAGLTWTNEAYCTAGTQCTEPAPTNGAGLFGPTFLVSGNPPTTPLPATLPLFAGGVALVGLLSRGKRRKASAASAVV